MEVAFTAPKATLQQATHLAHPHQEAELSLAVDASNHHVGVECEGCKYSKVYSENWCNFIPKVLQIFCVPLYSFLYSDKCSFHHRQVLQIIHTSLAIENSFMRSLVRGTNGPMFMLRETGTNDL